MPRFIRGVTGIHTIILTATIPMISIFTTSIPTPRTVATIIPALPNAVKGSSTSLPQKSRLRNQNKRKSGSSEGLGLTFDKSSIEGIYGSTFSDGNTVSLLYKGRESFKAIFSSIEKAQSLIALQFYIFRNDETGIELADLLRKKAKQGVSVFILFDHFGSWWTPKSFWNDLARAGVKIRASRPFLWTSPFHYSHRD